MKDIVVCADCYAKREGAGRKCAERGTVVHGTQDVSAFLNARRESINDKPSVAPGFVFVVILLSSVLLVFRGSGISS